MKYKCHHHRRGDETLSAQGNPVYEKLRFIEPRHCERALSTNINM
jgi:hypothetical protein